MSALLDQSVIGGLLLHAAVVLSVGIIWPAAHQRLLLPLADSGGTIIRRGRPACPDVPGMPSACTRNPPLTVAKGDPTAIDVRVDQTVLESATAGV